MKQKESERAQEEFQRYLFEMDDVLEVLISSAERIGVRLDFSPESLDELESLWLQEKRGADAELLASRCARYLGEVYRRNLGGRWQLELKDRRKAAFGLPVIAGFSERQYAVCPTLLFESFRAREGLGHLREAFETDRGFVGSPGAGQGA